MRVLRFLALVVLLNLIRYFVIGWIEWVTVLPPLFGAMAASPEVFRTDFTTFDWTTSYLYNFGVWLCAVGFFHLTRPVLRGSNLVASLKSFGLSWLFFASVSAVYMNHYRHPKDFYLLNILDALLVFGLVAVANGLLYRWVLGPYAAEPALDRRTTARA